MVLPYPMTQWIPEDELCRMYIENFGTPYSTPMKYNRWHAPRYTGANNFDTNTNSVASHYSEGNLAVFLLKERGCVNNPGPKHNKSLDSWEVARQIFTSPRYGEVDRQICLSFFRRADLPSLWISLYYIVFLGLISIKLHVHRTYFNGKGVTQMFDANVTVWHQYTKSNVNALCIQ